MPRKGVLAITIDGKNFLDEHKGIITPKDLKSFLGSLSLEILRTQEESTDTSYHFDEIDPEEN